MSVKRLMKKEAACNADVSSGHLELLTYVADAPIQLVVLSVLSPAFSVLLIAQHCP